MTIPLEQATCTVLSTTNTKDNQTKRTYSDLARLRRDSEYRSSTTGSLTSVHLESRIKFQVAMTTSFAISSVGSCSDGVDVADAFNGGDELDRPMKPIPGREILVPDGIGSEERKPVPVSVTLVDRVKRRKDREPSEGSKTRMSW